MAGGLQDVLIWSEPVELLTKYGKRWVRSWTIPVEYVEGFFIFWKKNKEHLSKKGYSIGKNNAGKWSLFEWQKKCKDFRQSFGKDNPETIIPTTSSLPVYDLRCTDGLRPWQVGTVSRLVSAIRTHGAAIDGSDTGTGKTYSAVAVARELGMRIAVICPKAVISPWTKIITGHFKLKPEVVLNYESVKTGKHENVGVWKKVSKNSIHEKFVWTLPKDTLIIFDESHRLKGNGTQNSEMAIEAKRQGYSILCCSATNAINPIELKAVGFVLGLYKSGKWTAYLKDHSCEQGQYGWAFNGDKKVLSKLHADLFLERGIRLKKDDIPGFPENEIIAEAYDVDVSSQSAMKSIYDEMNGELALLKAKCKNAKEWQSNSMVIQLRARQKAELIKVPLFVEMVEEAIENGMSVAVFVNFSETIRALSARLNTNCIVWGENKDEAERDKNIEDFQNDRSRVILVNIKAGGAGLSLHQITSKFPRISIISPTPSAVDLRQVLGRIHRDGSKSKSIQKIVFVAGTEEENTCDAVKRKLEHLDLINDGDLLMGKSF